MNEEDNKVTDTNSTSEENQTEKVKSEEELAVEAEQKKTEEEAANKKSEDDANSNDFNFAEELNKLEAGKPQEKHVERSEEEKALFSYKKIEERFPHFKETKENTASVDGAVAEMQEGLLRNQVEGIFRASSKNPDEVKYKMYFYDNRIQHTGNIHDDAESAEWLANKGRTQNAISEMKRDPGSPASSEGAGQKTPSGAAPTLPPEEHKRLIAAGLKKVAPGKYEGEKTIIEWDTKAQQWNQTMK